jgi:hypothetical protein
VIAVAIGEIIETGEKGELNTIAETLLYLPDNTLTAD